MHWKAGQAILSGNIVSKTSSITRDKKEDYVMIRGSIAKEKEKKLSQWCA